jgi:hypothetical protein
MVARLFFGFTNSSTSGREPKVPIPVRVTTIKIKRMGLRKRIQSHFTYLLDF